MMELCLLSLCLTIRDHQDRYAGIGQATIVVVTTLTTVAHHLFLEQSLDPVLTHLPASPDSPANRLAPVGLRYRPQIVSLLLSTELSPGLRESITAFANSQLRSCRMEYRLGPAQDHRLSIWIPRDNLGVSDDEVDRAQDLFRGVIVSNDAAKIDDDGHVVLSRLVSK